MARKGKKKTKKLSELLDSSLDSQECKTQAATLSLKMPQTQENMFFTQQPAPNFTGTFKNCIPSEMDIIQFEKALQSVFPGEERIISANIKDIISNQDFCLILRQLDNPQKPARKPVELILTNAFDRLFLLPINFDFVDAHRSKIGIQGTWTAYFELFQKALSKQNGGVIEAQVPALKQSTEQPNLAIYYPLLEGARIRGVIDLTTYEVKGVERHELIRDMFFLISAKISGLKDHVLTPKITQKIDFVAPIPMNLSKKRVFPKSLLNPNKGVRKQAKGAKFLEAVDDSD